jgi:hypothetical protein
MRKVTILLAALGSLSLFAPRAHAGAQPGTPAPAFTKPQLFTNTPHSLSDYAGKVLFIFELGYD